MMAASVTLDDAHHSYGTKVLERAQYVAPRGPDGRHQSQGAGARHAGRSLTEREISSSGWAKSGANSGICHVINVPLPLDKEEHVDVLAHTVRIKAE